MYDSYSSDKASNGIPYDARADHHSPEYDPEHFEEIDEPEPDDADFSGSSHDNNGNEYPDTDR
jgi:hypothetical protein